MEHIFKTAAGVVIGLLLVQVLNIKYLEYTTNKVISEYEDVAGLTNKAIDLIQEARLQLALDKALPSNITELDCVQHSKCADYFDGAAYYIHNAGHWMKIEPFTKPSKSYFCSQKSKEEIDAPSSNCMSFDFICFSTVPNLKTTPFNECKSMTLDEIPVIAINSI